MNDEHSSITEITQDDKLLDYISEHVTWLPKICSEAEGKWLEYHFVQKYYEDTGVIQVDSTHCKEKWPMEDLVFSFVEASSFLMLDIGCGKQGTFCHSLWNGESRPTALLWFGLDRHEDIVSSFIIRNSRRLVLTEGIIADGQQLPFRNEVFDTVICQGVLHHCATINSRRNMVENMSRLFYTKDSMLFYLAVCAFEQEGKSFASQDILVPDERGRRVYYHLFTRDELAGLTGWSTNIVTSDDKHIIVKYWSKARLKGFIDL